MNLESIECVKCANKMPLLRYTLYGYNYCIKCSTVEKVGGVVIVNHKTGNEIQIMPAEIASRLYRLSQRSGYGVCNGMKSN